ncbi:14306_t:CDS:2, partial [Entrophospora sp. SA101]
DEHEQHHCENETCPIECPISDCQRRCQSNDHFHAYTQLAVDHFCGNDHQCIEDCEEPGICKILTEPRKEEATYQGLVTETSITFTKYIQQCERLKCKKRIPLNSFSHEGIHSHDSSAESKFHYCDKKCEFCKYYCKLAYGHTQTLHETTHGNMVQTVFTSEDDEFEYNHHKLKIGDQGSFVLCNFHCKELGRHRHIDYCQSVDACKNGHQGQGIIHLGCPNPDQKKDFVTHKLFWERTGFKDPYSQQDQALFAKCDHECPDEDHKKQQNPNCPPPKSYCELELFHKPLNPSSSASTGIGYISLDGHQFSCDNPNKKEAEFHVIFALDRSGSMSYTDSRPLENIRSDIRQKIAQKHNNRIGAVYSFMDTRLKSQQNQAHDALLDKMMLHPARGGTNFDLAIQKAGFLIDKHYDPAKTNVVIFLSDGLCGAPDSRLETICKKNQQRGSPLYLYTVLFSSDSSSPSLEKMVTIAQKYLPANSSSKALKCQFTKAINEVALATHFTVVAESLSHKPSLMRKL